MSNAEYARKKIEYSYDLSKNRKFFKKARGIVVKDKELLVIKVTFADGGVHYLLPGGGVDEGETVRQAVQREVKEEYNINATPIKYLGKQYYRIKLKLDDIAFISNRVEYYYICQYISKNDSVPFGIDGEFEARDRVYEKTTLTLDILKQINHKDLNDMDKRNFDKLIEYMESIKE